MIETTESFSVQVSDGTTQLATLQCSYTPRKRVTTSMTLTSAYQEESHLELVEEALKNFQAEVLARLIEADMPIPARD